jgi:hypothetical protein
MTSTGNPEILDGMRAWQAAVVRLWSASDDAFAMLTLSWLPEGAPGAPWTVRLRYGDEGQESWSEDVRILGAPTVQQALRRLWDRARLHHGLLPEGPDHPAFPDDVAGDVWLTSDELALIERLDVALQPRQPIAVQLSYQPELGLNSQWVAVLHDPGKEPPEGVTLTIRAAHLAEVCEMLIEAAGS